MSVMLPPSAADEPATATARTVIDASAATSRWSVSVVAATIGVALLALLPACGSSDGGGSAGLGESVARPGSDADPVAAHSDETLTDADRLDENQQLFETTVGSDYRLVFDVVSSVTAEAGPVTVEVRDRRPVDVEYPDEMTERILPDIPLLTVNDFFTRARAVLSESGRVEVEFDASYGYPLVMSFDPVPDAIDDELSITVRSVEPLDPIADEVEGY